MTPEPTTHRCDTTGPDRLYDHGSHDGGPPRTCVRRHGIYILEGGLSVCERASIRAARVEAYRRQLEGGAREIDFAAGVREASGS